jgi:ribosome-associated toxin RatA of RatAB toxin-antitoxin module
VRSTLGVDVGAPAELVFALARDVERWPDLLPHYRRVRVRERHPDGAVTAEMLAIRAVLPIVGLGIPVAWRSRTWSEPGELRLRFVHRGGATDGMDVTWRIEPTPTGCRVSIEHEFQPRSPLWASLINGLFVRPIATRTLATFKAIAEAVVTSGGGGVAGAVGDVRSKSEPRSNTRT